MTVGTPDVVTQVISMVKNDEIDKFVALYEEEIIKAIPAYPCQNLGQSLCGQCQTACDLGI